MPRYGEITYNQGFTATGRVPFRDGLVGSELDSFHLSRTCKTDERVKELYGSGRRPLLVH